MLISGPEFSGKTRLLEQLIASRPERNTIRLYLTNTLDLKSLIGTYVCSERIGEFEWRDGPLSVAFKTGSLLVFENLQEAKEELFELLASVIEERISIRELGGVPRHINFKVVGTWTVGTNLLRDSEIEEFVNLKPYISTVELTKIDQELILSGCDAPKIIIDIIKKLHTASVAISEDLKDHCFSPDILKLERFCNRMAY